MTERRLPQTAVENLVEDLASKANADLSNLDATGQAKFDAKGNIDLTNLSAIGNDKFVTKDTAQTIRGVKTFSASALRANTPVLLKQNNANEGGQIDFERSDNSVLKGNPYIDLLINTMRFIGVNSQNVLHIPLTVDFENGKIYSTTPPADAINNEVINAEWVNSKKETIVGWGRPNWSAVIAVSSGYVAVKNGWGMGTLYSDWGGASGYLYVNGVEVASNAHAAGGSGKGHNNTFIFPMSKGDTLTASGRYSNLRFAPDKE